MARENNFLLGKGEKLTGIVDVPSGGGPKKPPYEFSKAKTRLNEKLEKTTEFFSKVPAVACPGEEVVALMTLHPRYLSKSDFPQDLLRTVGLRAVGTRPKKIKPESWGIKKHPHEAMAEQVFIAGKKSVFGNWIEKISEWTEKTTGAYSIVQIEDLVPFQAEDKLRGIPKDRDDAILEIVLHNLGRDQILDEFCAYAKTLDSLPIVDRSKKLNGLTFVPVRSNLKNIEKLAAFTFVRVARGMPSIRPVPTSILRGSTNFALEMPTEGPLSNDVRAVIFDGGLPSSVDLGKWVQYIQPPGIGQPIPNYVLHGLGVTSAFLFGSIHQGVPLRRPFCHVDHVRVLDATPNRELEYIDVLDRILAHLDANNGKYKFVNLSLGPDFPMEDDDVNLWTSSLDVRFCTSDILATVAAGNNGELDASLNLNRIQPPSDGVNVLSVGASDRSTAEWKRANYSSVGPGRSPGFVKPDGVAFGGSDIEPFMVLAASSRPQARPDGGTSFASPFVLGGAAGTSVFAGDDLHSLAIRALLIHRAEAKTHSRTEVGWGLLHTDPKILMTCEDHEAMVVYQGDLPLGQHLRAMIPVPIGPMTGPITLRATLAIAPDVDPEHPGTYTRGGLEVCFRPDMRKFTSSKDGKKSAHPKTKPFFSGSKLFRTSEFRLREEGFKWEPCIRHEQSFRSGSLHKPCFDIWFHHRAGAIPTKDPKALPYALVVSLFAPKDPNFYNRVVQSYENILIPLKPRIQIPVSV